MKGYYVIPRDGELIEINGKNARTRAIKKAKELIINQNDNDVIVQQFDDNNEGGYMNELEYLYASKIMQMKL